MKGMAIECKLFQERDPTTPLNSGIQRYILRDDIDICICTSFVEQQYTVPRREVDRGVYPIWYTSLMLSTGELDALKLQLGCQGKYTHSLPQLIKSAKSSVQRLYFITRTTVTPLSVQNDLRCKTHHLCVNPGILFERQWKQICYARNMPTRNHPEQMGTSEKYLRDWGILCM